LPLGVLLAAAKRKPVVYDAHESLPDMLAGNVPPWIRRGLARLERFLVRRVNLVITVGERLRRHFEEIGARRAVTVGNWKRLEEYTRTEEQNRAVRSKLGIPNDALVVTYITQLLKDRQIGELLDAVDATPKVWAIIGGAGALESAIVERAKKNPRIVFVGFVLAEDIPRYTCAADAIYYGFDPTNPNARYSAPNKLFEALASGRPLITAEFGEIGDVVRRADCGILLERYSGAAIQEALAAVADVSRRKRLADNARRCGRTMMNWTHASDILCREYSALLPESELV
jgi:glycosyltransferase involved in cell wall biosynthesis